MFQPSRLLTRRLLLGYSRPALAAKVGTTRMSILNWECGTYTPRPATVLRLAKALRTTPDYFYLTASSASGNGTENNP
jgi:transcriptional regulator with XRE-family HTH domain